jgi:serine/threonine protein kinase
LQHPHIVQIYEVGEHQGRPYFSLEFVDGGSLAQKQAGTLLPARQAAQLVETLAGAVHAAHERGIIHRDLKPANVLLTADGIPKVTDFGLAKRVDAGPGLTESGVILGTPSYMAPEQASGKSKQIGPACDVYALGAILYELLTGRPPFRAETPLDTVLQVLHEEPVSPSRLQPKLPRDLETICLKALAKAPTRRYATARELAEDLRRFLSGKPVYARPVGQAQRLWRWCRRNPFMSSLGAVAALSLLAGTAISIYFAVQANARAREALDEKAKLNRQLYYTRIGQAHAEWLANDVGRAEELLSACPTEMRGWEWRYLAGICNPSLKTLSVPYAAESYSVAFSTDGHILVSGGLWRGGLAQQRWVLAAR